jgi:hypothetical protein
VLKRDDGLTPFSLVEVRRYFRQLSTVNNSECESMHVQNMVHTQCLLSLLRHRELWRLGRNACGSQTSADQRFGGSTLSEGSGELLRILGRLEQERGVVGGPWPARERSGGYEIQPFGVANVNFGPNSQFPRSATGTRVRKPDQVQPRAA